MRSLINVTKSVRTTGKEAKTEFNGLPTKRFSWLTQFEKWMSILDATLMFLLQRRKSDVGWDLGLFPCEAQGAINDLNDNVLSYTITRIFWQFICVDWQLSLPEFQVKILEQNVISTRALLVASSLKLQVLS
uniref:Uncharacterized protein n=1 Tax=Solanum lycopersicum TaxID=4081 RepID=A0A3Q7JK77_SOLLC